ncbi:TRAP transporter small permease [Roseomonas sp. AR75]|uniref:TRAP transporter small permease n=1 Tax=Roseomonas sp. AR75 TaxID=2562311 RepID=UPI00148583A0|nr:TRAP transporter small permease [Roseomonas sp. AR75]
MILTLLGRAHALLRLVVGLTFALLLAAVLVQVVSRLGLPNPPVWTEELSRFCLLFAAAFGIGLALRSGELVGVDLLTMMLPPRGRRVAEILSCLVMIGFGLLLVQPAWAFVDIGSLQTSPALQWNMFWVHMAVLVAPLALVLAAAERLLRVLAGLAPEVR